MLCKAVWCASQSVQCALFNTVTSDFAYTLLLFVANQIVGRIFLVNSKHLFDEQPLGGSERARTTKTKLPNLNVQTNQLIFNE